MTCVFRQKKISHTIMASFEDAEAHCEEDFMSTRRLSSIGSWADEVEKVEQEEAEESRRSRPSSASSDQLSKDWIHRMPPIKAQESNNQITHVMKTVDHESDEDSDEVEEFVMLSSNKSPVVDIEDDSDTDDSANDLDKCKKCLSSILSSNKGGLPGAMLVSKYKDMFGESVPYRKFNFSSLKTFLQSIPDVCRIITMKGGEMMVVGVETPETKHIKVRAEYFAKIT